MRKTGRAIQQHVGKPVVKGGGDASRRALRKTGVASLLRISGAVIALSLLPFSACEAMNKCMQADGGFIYQEQPCVGNTESAAFSNPELQAKQRLEDAMSKQEARLQAAPPVGSADSAARPKPLVHEVEVDVLQRVGVGAALRDINKGNERGLELFLVLFMIAGVYAGLVWPFWVARWAGYNDRSAVLWFFVSLITSPFFAGILLRVIDGPNASPNKGKMLQRFAVAGLFLSLALLVGAWGVYRENSAFRNFGQKAFVAPVNEYTLETSMYTNRGTGEKSALSKRYIVDANFVTADGRSIQAAEKVPERLVQKVINGEQVGLTYLSNAPERVRFEGENPQPAGGLIAGIVTLLISLPLWLMARRARATAPESWSR